MTISVLWLILTVPWVGLQCYIVEFPDHTHLLFSYFTYPAIIAKLSHIFIQVICYKVFSAHA